MPSSKFQSPYGGRGYINIRYMREQQQHHNQHQHQRHQRVARHSNQQQQQQHQQRKRMMDRFASAQEYVQKLNNVSAMSIELGNYNKAIESLRKALKLFDDEIQITDQLLDPCTSQDCSIDSCIHHTENDSNLVELLNMSNKNNKKNSKRNVMMMDVDDDDKSNTLYQRPIRIPKRIIREGLNMGSTLFLIIMFNLALAHHLKAMKKTSSDLSSALLLLNSTVQLYDLANNWQQQHPQNNNNYVTDDDDYEYDDEDDTVLCMEHDVDTNSSSSYYSVRFNTILYNNLNHLKQLLITRNNNNNNDRNYDTSSPKRRLDNLISSVFTHIVTCDHDEESNSTKFMKEEDNDDLEFEYYKEKEMKKYSRDDLLIKDGFSSQHTARRTSSSIPSQNVRCAYAA